MKIKIGLFICVISSLISIYSFNKISLFSRSKLSKSLELIDMAYKYQDNKNYAEAIKYFSKLIELDNQDFYAYYNRGWNKAKMKKYKMAMEDFEKAIEFNPNFSMAYINKGVMNYYLGQYSDSISDYEKAIKLDNKNLSIFYNRALSKIAQGDNSKSICSDLEISKSINYFEISNLLNEYCYKTKV